MKSIILNPTDYHASVAEYRDRWQLIDQTLYTVCAEHYTHVARSEVNAKLWLVGRTYATGIERKVPSDGRQGGSLTRVADKLLACHASLDKDFARLQSIQEPLGIKDLQVILQVHGRLVQRLSTITRGGQATRAFASKYMHFHCPAVPIMDSIVTRTIPKLVRWRKGLEVIKPLKQVDEAYWKYVMRFWQLYQEARALGLQPTVKHLDYYLLYVWANRSVM